MRLWLTILTVVALVVPTVSFAADGDGCTVGKITKGEWRTTACVRVCDDHLAAEDSCLAHDFNTGGGLSDLVVFEYVEDAGSSCGGTPDITITTGPVLTTTDTGVPDYELSSTSAVLNSTTDRIVVVTKDASFDRYLFFAVADDAGCITGDLAVRMHLLDNRN
jgi:hypothetical protein